MQQPLGWLLTLALLLSVAGCRYRDPSVDMLENEARWLEDQVYALQDELALKCAQLAECQRAQSCICEPELADSVLRGSPNSTNDQDLPKEPRVTVPGDDTYEIMPPERPLKTPPRRGREPESSGGADTRAPVVEMPSESESPNYVLPKDAQDSPAEDYEPRAPKIETPPYEVVPDDEPASPPSSEPKLSDSPENYIIVRESQPELIMPPDAAEESDLDVPIPDELPTPAVRPRLEKSGRQTPPSPSSLDISLAGFADQHPDDAEIVTDDYQGESGSRNSRPRRSEQPSASTRVVDAHLTHLWARAWLVPNTIANDETSVSKIMVQIEPRNAAGEFVQLSGPISIVVLDGERQDQTARVGRWDFTRAEVKRNLCETEWGPGIFCELQLARTRPISQKLQVFVRYTTADGRKLEWDDRVQERPPKSSADQGTHGWRRISSAAFPLASPAATPTLLPGEPRIQLRRIPKATADAKQVDSSGDEPLPVSDDGKLEETPLPLWRPEP